MPNDDLGTFPTPQSAPVSPAEPASNPPVAQDAVSEPSPIIPQETSVSTTPPEEIPSPVSQPEPVSSNAFEPTPEEIPSAQPVLQPNQHLLDEQDKLVDANENMISQAAPIEPTPPPTQPAPAEPTPVPATAPVKTRSFAPILIIILLLVAAAGIAYATYLSQQSSKLKSQLSEITQTLEKQQTILTPTATPTVFEIPTPTATPTATPSATPTATPSATPTISFSNKLLPLANAASALKVAINRSPNAQLILIKVDNASDQTTAVTKYFFREDQTTKKYFYVAISGTGNPELIDKQIYVTPDDNIPSLNDAVLGNKMGIELDQALKLTYALCSNQTTCTSSPVKAQYIKTGTGIIWQVSIYTKGLTASPLLTQINATSQAILYKSAEFATMAK